jgi:hypothetical protein
MDNKVQHHVKTQLTPIMLSLFLLTDIIVFFRSSLLDKRISTHHTRDMTPQRLQYPQLEAHCPDDYNPTHFNAEKISPRVSNEA